MTNLPKPLKAAILRSINCEAVGQRLGSHQEADMTATEIEAMEAIFAQHMDAETGGDLDTTLATMGADPHLVNVPTMVGGSGRDGVRSFYADHLIGQFFPPDVEFTPVSRTYGENRLVDELVISFTHTTAIDWMLPNVEPTGKRVSVAFVVIVGVDDGKISYEHIYWDQATVLVQIGLLDPTGLPVVGAQATGAVVGPVDPRAALLVVARQLATSGSRSCRSISTLMTSPSTTALTPGGSATSMSKSLRLIWADASKPA